MKNNNQPWIVNWKVDSAFILSPSFLVFLLIILFPSFFEEYNEEVPPFAWLILILAIDVSHVYATLFRTYFDSKEFQNNRPLYILVPLICFAVSCMVYSINPLLFWRLMAYLAVFHFIKQQYGFLKIYIRKDHNELSSKLDIFTIYAVTAIPILIWHLRGIGNFNWFVEHDFIYFNYPDLVFIFKIAFTIVGIIFIIKEIIVFIKSNYVNLPKNLLVLGTAISWYFGIVVNEGDLAFTALNVVSHGIPYIALVHIYSQKNKQPNFLEGRLNFIFKKGILGIICFLLILFAFGYFEEMIWDVFVWKEHRIFFGWAYPNQLAISPILISIVIPLLSLPQLTHYILDGFIWKHKHINN